MADDQVIRDVQHKIDREKGLMDAASRMRASTSNVAVQQQTENSIRENRRNIVYLEETLEKLMRLKLNGPNHRSSGAQDQNADYGTDDYSNLNNSATGPPRGPFGAIGPGGPMPKGKPNYLRLELIKNETPHLGPRIQLMLSQLQFKLNVEKQYKDGIEKIMTLSSMEGDKKVKQETQARRIESMQKITLLSLALKRYEDLHVDIDATGETADDDSINAPNLRKPLTGALSIRVLAIQNVNHAVTGRLTRGPETFVIMKVEDDVKARTKPTRIDKWTDEAFEIDIDKGNELELTVYDKAGGDYPRPVGMQWIRISDINEEMRRKKIETEFNNAGWVSASKMEDGGGPRPDMQFGPPPGGQTGFSASKPMGGAFGHSATSPQTQPVVIDAWFSLEPVGSIHLSMSFAKETRERRPFDAGLNRKGAIRQRKEDVHELFGHKFVSQTFYNIMRCALCGNLLKYSTGMQCSDCKYMCHQECYPLVVTKCISKPSAEGDPAEAKLNHRIPHRFETFSNMGASWCCHCGYLLPLGRKQCRRCKECKLAAHAHCTHLVPDFCGLSMKDANLILTAQEVANTRGQNATPSLRPNPPGPKPPPKQIQAPYSPDAFQDHLQQRDQRDPRDQRERNSWNDPNNDKNNRLSGGSGPGDNIYGSSRYSQGSTQPVPRRPVGAPRTESSLQAAAAAAAALANKAGSPIDNRPQHPPRGASSFTTSATVSGPTPQQMPVTRPYDPGAYAEVDKRGAPQPISTPPVQQAYQPMSTPNPASASIPQPPPKKQIEDQQARPSPVNQFVERKPEVAATKKSAPQIRIGLDHFNFLAVLGKGNFGKVMLAEAKSSKQLYAIKVLKKEFIIENDEVESTKSERDVFLIANRARHPFLTNLHACFQTETRVYFVMEYISGGDLMLHIQRGMFGAKRAQFYAAEVCLALKYFHENGVVYRDLKLDNILLAMDGHIKIADYGLCKKDMYYGSTTGTFCGTPEFMAPEILLEKKYGRAVDWWAFGVLIYQMLLQQSPFRGEDEDEIYDAILADEPLYPIHMPRDSVSILQKLLTREPEARLGSGPTDAQEIMSHAFFRTVDWDDVQQKRQAPPFLPQIKSATDTSNFDSEFTSVTPVLTPVQSVLSQAMQEEFRGFSYAADFV